MFIKVDIREQELITNINQLIANIPLFKDIKVVIETLPIGDIIISEGDDDILIIERKSINDLSASIKDGRYEEQSYRLNGLNHPNHNIIYLIEGDVNKMNRFRDTKMEKLTLYSAIFSLNYYKGFSVIRSFSLDESAIFICNTVNKLIKGKSADKKPFYRNHSIQQQQQQQQQQPEQQHSQVVTESNVLKMEEPPLENEQNNNDNDYVGVIKKVKKENITPDNIGAIMLCQIPGISSVTAIAIMDHFKTIPHLLKSVEENQTCLQNISYTNIKGQSRKINKTCITNIVKYLLKK
jgi:ERCC4-type nuclease